MYLLFSGYGYYPGGGWDDFKGKYDTVEEAIAAKNPEYDWHQIVDLERLEEI